MRYHLGKTARLRYAHVMLNSFSSAMAQLCDPRLRRVLWISLGSGLALVAILGLGIIGLLAITRFVTSYWLETLIDMAGALTTLVLFVTLFPALVSIISGLLLEEVARAVEARHYPLDIAVHRRRSLSERNCGNCCGCIGTDAWKL